MSKKNGDKKSNTVLLTDAKEMADGNKRAAEILDDAGVATIDNSTTHAVEGMEELGDELTDDQILALNTIIADVYPEPEEETRQSVYRRLYAAFKRSGMGDSKDDERRFFNILKDPKFVQLQADVGRGIIGSRIIKIVDTLCELAIEDKDKLAIKWALEITKLKKSKYDYYAEDANNRRPSINVGEINFAGKTDKELAAIRDGLLDVTDKAEITG